LTGVFSVIVLSEGAIMRAGRAQLPLRAAPSFCSDPFPETGLLVEAIQFETTEIETRNNPDDLSAFDNRQVPLAAVFHEA
jgi:hypothetical protein